LLGATGRRARKKKKKKKKGFCSCWARRDEDKERKRLAGDIFLAARYRGSFVFLTYFVFSSAGGEELNDRSLVAEFA
jgi:hypothetical protein